MFELRKLQKSHLSQTKKVKFSYPQIQMGFKGCIFF